MRICVDAPAGGRCSRIISSLTKPELYFQSGGTGGGDSDCVTRAGIPREYINYLSYLRVDDLGCTKA